MVLHRILQAIFGHPQVGPQLIQRLSETRPIRSAARLVAYAYLRSRAALEGNTSLERFKRNLQTEIRKGLEDAKRQQGRK